MQIAASPTDDWSLRVSFPNHKSVSRILNDIKRALADEALRRSDGRKRKAARLLGISRDSFYRYIRDDTQDEDKES